MQTTPEAVRFYNDAASTMAYLVARWSDEGKYEDINEYVKPLEPIAQKAGVKIEKMTKRPFGCIFSVYDAYFQLSITPAGRYGYRRVNFSNKEDLK